MAMVNQTILSIDFVANAGVESTADLQVPYAAANGTRLWVRVQLDQGIWETFTLNGLPEKCNRLTTVTGLTVSGGENNGSGGSNCLAQSGTHTLRFKVETGVVKGHLTVKAEVPA